MRDDDRRHDGAERGDPPSRVARVVAFGIAVASVIASASWSAAEPLRAPYWGQAQGHLESFDGAPLLAANWTGRYRPYVFAHDRFEPLVADTAAGATLDLYSPVPFTQDTILAAGSESGRAQYDLFRVDARSRTLENLTASPTVDEGHVCASAPARLVAFSADDREVVARLGAALEPLRGERIPALDECTWTDAGELIGVARRAGGYRVERCTVAGDEVRCVAAPALDGVDAFVRLLDGEPLGAIVRLRDETFRRGYRFGDGLQTLVPLAVPPTVRGDVLDAHADALRIGFHGRYTSSLAPDSAATVYTARKIGGVEYAIVATETWPRTLARLGGGGWELLRHPSVVVPSDVARPREIWLRSATGELYQAFYWGSDAPERVVLWWHGGPTESISPRFHPYYYRLNQLGFGVLAVNYPGSTGRGAAYERRFGKEAIADCLDAVWTYLRDNDVRVVVSWSVSTGSTVQTVLVRRGLPVSAIVDQAGWGRSTLLEDTRDRHIPFFAIRGRNDPNTPIANVDFWYPGGHDVTVADEFVALFDAVSPFLRAAPAIAYGAPVAGAVRLRIDLPDDAEEHAIAFELATQVARECFAPREVALSDNGSARLSPRPAEAAATDTKVPNVVLRLGGDSDAPPGAIVVHPFDRTRSPAAARLQERTIDSSGVLVRPYLRETARALCERLRAGPRGGPPGASPDQAIDSRR